VKSIDATINPPLYKLIDLLGDDIKQSFYVEQLTKCPAPDYKKKFFEVEKVLKTKTVKKQKFVLVKYLYYPNKFNQWLPITNLR